MTIGIDTSQTHARLYKEYRTTMFKESWYSWPHFLMVKILRLEKLVDEADTFLTDHSLCDCSRCKWRKKANGIRKN